MASPTSPPRQTDLFHSILERMVHAGVAMETMQSFAEHIQHRSYRSKDVLFRQGDSQAPIIFILDGFVKVVHTDDDGDETVRYLSGPQNFAACTQCLLFGEGSHYTATAVTDCRVLYINRYLQKLLLARADTRLAIQDIIIRRMDFLMEEKALMLPLRATERYLFFKERYPEFTERVPAAVVANYIGVRPQSLSRIKQNLK